MKCGIEYIERTDVILRKTRRRIRRLIQRTAHRFADALHPSYGRTDLCEGMARLIPSGLRFQLTEADLAAARHFLSHRFDLLGSGWTQVKYGMSCRGFEDIRFDAQPAVKVDARGRWIERHIARPNRKRARKIGALIAPGYEPIDWQLDFKSGFRWSGQTWYRDIRYGSAEGVDVKVPWELSRMQHLPELALAYSVTRATGYVTEFRNQVLDWIAMNPPRFGVNWACTMDVGIRIANWLVAFDLFRASGATFDGPFEAIVESAVHDHARHIAQNLEWSETRRANHYLANIAGLLMSAAYLPAGDETDAWLLFAIQELIVETERQFLPDGGHFEASTSYHRLCGEMVAVCAVFLQAIPKARVGGLRQTRPRRMPYAPGLRAETAEKVASTYEFTGSVLPKSVYEKLTRAVQFTRDLTKPDGTVPQIGDNDSGRFLRLGGWSIAASVTQCTSRYANLAGYSEMQPGQKCPLQNHLDHSQWLAWASAALRRPDLIDPPSAMTVIPLELAAALAGKTPSLGLPASAADGCMGDDGARWRTLVADLLDQPTSHRREGSYRPSSEGDLFGDAHFVSYPEFGVYIVRSSRIHLVIRCGPFNHDGRGTHAHEDQLSVELTVDGYAITLDPGSFIYTPSKDWRFKYRSAMAHVAPAVRDNSVVSVSRSMFSLRDAAESKCLHFGASGFAGRTNVPGGHVVRLVSFESDRVNLQDFYMLTPPYEPASLEVWTPAEPVPDSEGYGIRCR